jgi:protein O-GlcNAc transferase
MNETPRDFTVAEISKMPSSTVVDHFRIQVTQDPGNSRHQSNLGVALSRDSRPEEARRMMARAIKLKVDSSKAHRGLAKVQADLAEPSLALTSLRRSMCLCPADLETMEIDGLQRLIAGDHATAQRTLLHATVVAPSRWSAWIALSEALVRGNHPRRALAAAERATALKPNASKFHLACSKLHAKIGEFAAARVSITRSLCLHPGEADALLTKGLQDIDLGRPGPALRVLNQAINANPEAWASWISKSEVLVIQGKSEEARECLETLVNTIKIAPDVHSSVIFNLDHTQTWTIGESQTERRNWWSKHGAPLFNEKHQHQNNPKPDRKIRVGYISGDFRRHSAMDVFGPIILLHDRQQYSTFIYSNSHRYDERTEELARHADAWRNVTDDTDAELARRIVEDRIDILVDLSGHSAGNRLCTFACKPAPIQVSAWGYALGTGLAAMDYFLVDQTLVPPEDARHFSEKCISLPCLAPFRIPENPPAVTDAPVIRNGFVTFGSLNRLMKVTPFVVHCWADILKAVDGSKLLVKAADLEKVGKREMIERILARAMIDPDRISFIGRTTREEHLATYGQVDISLDSFPHSGGMTTWEALLMGVPVISWTGPVLAQRPSAGVLEVTDSTEFLAHDKAGYINLAINLARDTSRLREIRPTLRQRVLQSPGTDFKSYTKHVEEAYKHMWRQWCSGRLD